MVNRKQTLKGWKATYIALILSGAFAEPCSAKSIWGIFESFFSSKKTVPLSKNSNEKKGQAPVDQDFDEPAPVVPTPARQAPTHPAPASPAFEVFTRRSAPNRRRPTKVQELLENPAPNDQAPYLDPAYELQNFDEPAPVVQAPIIFSRRSAPNRRRPTEVQKLLEVSAHAVQAYDLQNFDEQVPAVPTPSHPIFADLASYYKASADQAPASPAHVIQAPAVPTPSHPIFADLASYYKASADQAPASPAHAVQAYDLQNFDEPAPAVPTPARQAPTHPAPASPAFEVFTRKAAPNRRRPTEVQELLEAQTPHLLAPVDPTYDLQDFDEQVPAVPTPSHPIFADLASYYKASADQAPARQAHEPASADQAPASPAHAVQAYDLQNFDEQAPAVPTPSHPIFADLASYYKASANQAPASPAHVIQAPAVPAPNTHIVTTVIDDQNTPGSHQQMEFVENFLGLNPLPQGTPVYKGQQLGAGAYGAVFAGHLGSPDGQAVVVKQGRSDQGLEDMRREENNSRAIVSAIAEQLGQEDAELGLSYGLGAVVPVLGVTGDGSLVQNQVPGVTLERCVLEGIAPYDTPGHFPRNLQKIVCMSAELFLALVSIHNADYVHSDMKFDNVMVAILSDIIPSDIIPASPSGEAHIRVIDLGNATKIGKSYLAFFSNGGPECVLKSFQSLEIQSKINDFTEKLKVVSQQIEDLKRKLPSPNIPSPDSGSSLSLEEQTKQLIDMEKKRSYIRSIDHKLLEKKQQLRWREIFLKRSIEFFKESKKSILMPTAHPSYDIYASVPVLLALLFGEEGYKLGKRLFFHDLATPQYVHDANQPGFNGYEYFYRLLTDPNQKMIAAMGRGYPEPILQRLAYTLSKMASIDPERRPTAAEIADICTDMGLADWQRGFFFIQK